MSGDKPATEDFVDRLIKAERALTEKDFASRDRALDLALSNTHWKLTTVIAVIALIISMLAIFTKH